MIGNHRGLPGHTDSREVVISGTHDSPHTRTSQLLDNYPAEDVCLGRRELIDTRLD